MEKTELSPVQKKAIDVYAKTGSVVQVANTLKVSPTRARVVMAAARERLMEAFIRGKELVGDFKRHSGYGEEIFFTPKPPVMKKDKTAPRAKKTGVVHKAAKTKRVARPVKAEGVTHTVAAS